MYLSQDYILLFYTCLVPNRIAQIPWFKYEKNCARFYDVLQFVAQQKTQLDVGAKPCQNVLQLMPGLLA